jgi:D-hydroxyproline dehydrogenase subunit gamma
VDSHRGKAGGADRKPAGAVDRRLAGAVERGRRIQILVDGLEATAFEGECVAAALLASGRRELRVTPRRGEPRGMYCGIGVCFECLMVIDDRHARACQTPVRDGMQICVYRLPASDGEDAR